MKFKCLVLLAIAVLPATAEAQRFSLGTAQSFGVLGGQTVTNTGPTVINGNVGVSPGSSVTGFPPGSVVAPGTIHIADAVALQAQNDVTASYTVLAGMAVTQDLTGQNLGGLTLTPGVYHFSSAAQLTGALTLNTLGNPNALFVFQIVSNLTTASGSSVQFINGSDNCNVFWQVGASATLGTTTDFKGNILANTSIALSTGANDVSGRTLARNGSVTLDTNHVSMAGCSFITGPAGTFGASVPEPGIAALLAGLGIPVAALRARRRIRRRHSGS
jgi:hypothetical protein